MEFKYMDALQMGGFNYDNCLRNKAMLAQSKTGTQVKTMKTGTTICGIIFKVSLIPFFHLSQLSSSERWALSHLPPILTFFSLTGWRCTRC